MNKTTTYYQPELYFDNGTTLEWNIPTEILSYQAFASKEDLKLFMKENEYKEGEYVIREYHDEDIENVVILDGEGSVIEVNEESNEEVSLLTEFIDWAKELKEQYIEAESNADLAQVCDRMADFIYSFIDKANEL